MTTPKKRSENLLELSAWIFMRVSGTALLVLAVFHLIYLHFIIPGGVAAIDYSVIAARWADPSWGFFWRFFDLLLLAFGLTHGSTGLRYVINDYIRPGVRQRAAKFCLGLVYLVLLVMGTVIIFSFRRVQ